MTDIHFLLIGYLFYPGIIFTFYAIADDTRYGINLIFYTTVSSFTIFAKPTDYRLTVGDKIKITFRKCLLHYIFCYQFKGSFRTVIRLYTEHEIHSSNYYNTKSNESVSAVAEM